MSGVSGVDCRRKTEELVDDVAHDAGIAKNDEHVKARAGLRSSAEAWEARNHHGGVGTAAGHVALDGARELAPEIIDHVLFESAAGAALKGAAAGTIAAFSVIGATVIGARQLYEHAWADAHAKGDEIRSLAQNDAVNVALAKTLAFHPGFGTHEAAHRPGVEKGAGKVIDALHGKDAALVPILQSRADEGFLAMERAHAATKHLAGSPDRAAAIVKWLDDNGFAEKRRGDVAFGKGGEYFNWLHGMGARAGADVAAETRKVHDRQASPATFQCRA